jgi:hypothetical protein
MHLHPNPVLALAHLQRAATAGTPEVPVVAPDAPGQLALASKNEAVLATLLENVSGRELKIEFKHECP